MSITAVLAVVWSPSFLGLLTRCSFNKWLKSRLIILYMTRTDRSFACSKGYIVKVLRVLMAIRHDLVHLCRGHSVSFFLLQTKYFDYSMIERLQRDWNTGMENEELNVTKMNGWVEKAGSKTCICSRTACDSDSPSDRRAGVKTEASCGIKGICDRIKYGLYNVNSF